MRRILTVGIFVLASALGAAAQINQINTVAGGGAEPGTAATAYLPEPFAAVRDKVGNTYISVPTLYEVFKVDTAGNLTVYAGTGIGGFSGDGGAATSAQLSFPEGLAIDGNGNLFIADFYNERIRRVDATTHIITTVAGSEDPFFGNYGGDGGPATNARLNGPEAVAVDANDNLFIADTNNGVVRRVDAITGNITTYAGNISAAAAGCPSGSATATNVGFGDATGVAVDASGNVFVSDMVAQVVCKITTSQTISVYAGTLDTAGTPGQPNGDGGAATAAKLLQPRGLTTDPTGNLYIADAGNPKIRKVTVSTGVISTVAGIGLICTNAQEPSCGDGGAATSADFNFPEGVFYDSLGNLVVTDTDNMRVRVVSNGSTPTVAALAGGGTGGDGGAATSGIMGLPQYLAVDASENVYALESNGERLRKVTIPSGSQTGNLSTVAGDGLGGATIDCNGATCGSANNGDGGPATQARFVLPISLAIDANGNYYILDLDTAVVRMVNKETSAITVAGVTIQPGNIATIAGNGARCGSGGNPNTRPLCGDGGAATSASLFQPYAIAVDANGIVYIGDAGLSTVRAVNTGTSAITLAGVQIAAGDIATIAGTPESQCLTYLSNGCGNFSAATSAMLSFPIGLAVSGTDLYIADSGDNVVRDVSLETGAISPYAFNGLPSFGGDDETALGASMNGPSQLAIDARSNLYVTGGSDNVVRRVDFSDGSIVTVAGDVNNLGGGFSGDGGPSTAALMGDYGIAIFNTATPTDDLFIGDTVSNRVRRVNLAPVGMVDPSSGTALTFGPALAGRIGTASQDISLANDGLDDLILTAKVTGTNATAFALPLANGPNGTYIFQVSPGSAGDLIVEFNPPAGSAGTLTGTLTITTNDKANPTLTYPLSGTVGAPATLNVTISPTSGSPGSVESGDGTVLCPTTCSGTFPMGETVTLFATPGVGFAFQSWNTGNAPEAANCNGTTAPECTFTITASGETVNAIFTNSTSAGTYTITVVGLGNGSGTVTGGVVGGAQINCTITNGVAGSTGCSQMFSSVTSPKGITLTSTASTGGSVFVGYLGECTAVTTNASQCTTLPITSSVGAVFSGPPVAFAKGQVFLDLGPMVFVLNPSTGAVVQVLNDVTNGNGEGMTFDSVGNLYIALDFGYLSVFSNQAAGPTKFGDYATDNQAASVVFDPSGDAIVGEDFVTGNEQPTLLEYGPGTGATTAPSFTYYPAFINSSNPAFWVELLDSSDTVAYTLGTNTIKIFDLGEQNQHPDIIPNLPQTPAPPVLYALRELPDTSLLVAEGSQIVRVSQTGAIVKTYTAGTGAIFQNLNLDPDGATFWTNDQVTGTVYRINLTSGAVVSTFTTNLGFTSGLFTPGISGIAVFGQPQSGGADVAVTMTAPGSVTQNSNVTFTATVVNNGPLAATNVNLTDALPAGATLVSTTSPLSPGGTCAGTTTLTCPLGTMASGAKTTITIVVTATQTGTLTNTVNVTSGVPDPNQTNNSATTNTTVNSVAMFTLTVSENGTGSGTVSSGDSQILCPSTCSASYASGTQVVLTATPNSGSAFAGWSGACTNTSGTCTVTMSQARSVTATFNTTGTSLTFTSTTLPAGAVGVPYGLDLQALVNGGTPPYTIALQSGSTLPTGFTLETPNGTGNVAQGHIFNDSPATAGTFTFGVTVTDSSSPAQVANATLSLTIGTLPNTQAALLKGQYAVEIVAYPDCGDSGNNCPTGSATEALFVGSLTFDGIGSVTGVMDANTPGNGVQQDVAVTGTYTVGPDNRGFLTIPSGVGGTGIHAAFSVGTVYRGVAYSGRFTGFRDDDGNHGMGAGFLRKQDPTAFTPNSFAGTYVYAVSGQGPTGVRSGIAGLITFDNALNVISGSEDVNEGGKLGGFTSITGSYTAPDTNGRTVLTLTLSNNTKTSNSTVAVYIVSANQLIPMNLDTRASNDLETGIAVRQANPGSFTASSLVGPDVLSLNGVSGSGGNFAGVGVLAVSGGTLTVTLDRNDGGNVLLGDVATGTAPVAANGRVPFSVTDTTTQAKGAGVIYLAGPDSGFVLIADSSVAIGPLTPQVGGPFAGTSFTGNVYFGQQEAVSGTGSDFSGASTSVGSGTFNSTDDETHHGGNLLYDQNIGGITYSVDSKGQVTGQVSDGSNLAGYEINPSEVAIFDTTGPASDPTPSAHPNLIIFQTIAAPKGTPSPASTSVNFPTAVAIGSNAQSSPITITNSGLGPLGISGVGTPPDFSFASTSTCLANNPEVLQPGQSCNFVVTFAPSSSAKPGAQLNETITATTDGTANISITATGTVAAAGTPALGITKSHTGNFTQGQTGATYTVTVSNGAGAGPTSGTVTVTENAPSGLTVSNMAGTGWTCELPSVSACTRSDVLAAGASYPTITVTVNVGTTATSPQVNSVTVSGGGSASATATDSTVISPSSAPANLAITKTHTGNFTQGQTGATYTVTVSNGASAGPTSGTVTMTENAPSGLTVSGMAGTGWTCTTLNCTRADALAAGASYPAITVTVNVAANAPGTVTNSVTASGGGSSSVTTTNPTTVIAEPLLSVTKSHNGNFTQGQTGATYTVTVSNGASAGPTSGTVTMAENPPSGLTVTGMAGTGWTCTTATCTRADALAAGASYPAITVTVNVPSNASSPQVNSVSVSGGGETGPAATGTDPTTVVPPSPPVATLNPAGGSTLAFGNQAENVASASKPVTLTNTGTAALTVTSISVTAGGANFTQTNNCPASLPTGTPAPASCTINVVFDPTALGPLTGTLTVTTNDPKNPTQTITLSGTGVPSGPAVATLNPAGGSTLAFGNQAVNVGSKPMTVTLTNTGGAPLTVSGISITQEIKGFTQTNNCPASLAVTFPAASCTINVVFTPTSLTGFSGVLLVTTNDQKNPTQSITLSGTGVPGGAVTLSATTVNFGDEVINIKSGPQSVTLTNSGSGPLSITSIVANGDYAQTNTCPVGSDTTPIAPNGTCTISITFTPTQTGARNGSVVLSDNATNSPQTITLTGTGTMIGLAPAPGSPTTVTVNPGGTGVFGLILVTPPGTTGTATLTCSSPDGTITCAVVPSTVNLTGKTVETAIIVNSYCTANTSPMGGPDNQTPLGRLPFFWLLGLCALAMFTLLSLPKTQRQRVRLAMAPALLALVMMINAACGNLPKSPTGAATPPGTYMLNITATLDNTSFTIPVTLIVK